MGRLKRLWSDGWFTTGLLAWNVGWLILNVATWRENPPWGWLAIAVWFGMIASQVYSMGYRHASYKLGEVIRAQDAQIRAQTTELQRAVQERIRIVPVPVMQVYSDDGEWTNISMGVSLN